MFYHLIQELHRPRIQLPHVHFHLTIQQAVEIGGIANGELPLLSGWNAFIEQHADVQITFCPHPTTSVGTVEVCQSHLGLRGEKLS